MLISRSRLAPLAAVVLTVACAGCSGPAAATRMSSPVAFSSSPASSPAAGSSATGPSTTGSSAADRRDIGALLRYRDGKLLWHCGAAVVASRSGDVIATAAHCVSTRRVTYAFAPGDTPSGAPLGLWQVVSVHTDPAWQTHTDPLDDVAFLTVRSRVEDGKVVTLQQVTGALRLGTTVAAVGRTVQLVAYPSDRLGRHLTCTTTLRLTGAYPTATCPSFTSGTSGSPFIGPGERLVGVVGGLQSGGCTPDVSYSSPFTSALQRLLAAAADAARSSPPPRTLGPTRCP